MATVTVNIERTPDPKAAVTEGRRRRLPRRARRRLGRASRRTVVAVATVVGALLPFAVVVLRWSASRSGCWSVGCAGHRPPFRVVRLTQRPDAA